MDLASFASTPSDTQRVDSAAGPRPEHEAQLVVAARRDARAFEALYRRHAPAILAYLRRRVGDEPHVDDLLSDVFVAALSGLRRFRSRGVPFRHWLYGIAARHVARHRSRRRPCSLGDLGPEHEPVTEEVSAELVALRRALDDLAPRHHLVVTLHHLEGLSIDELVGLTGWRPGTVKSRLARGRQALAARLEHHLDGGA